jgi:hypothetical protein
MGAPAPFTNVIDWGLLPLILILPLASLVTSTVPEPEILWADLTEEFSKWFKYTFPFVAVALAVAVELAPTIFLLV